ncbi:hypothetical protein SAMN05216343_12312 [Oscillibacter sp. PC13]|uniref:hypothetical protein n=1 Tax=Oscillibacter sp. PC13 TaxID=1855299 RepID=UPI0008EBA1D2|nr:hypothetical protein [Oscillibacter sp. PC13]SFQ08330.1 hypothetical protein SAMN05216343_12312 [Oscillibacter sp. PC13]
MKVKQQCMIWAVALAALTVLLTGCSGAAAEQAPPAQNVSKIESIPFSEGQLYAAVYLGYQEMQDLSYYVEQYLDSGDLPIHYFSDGEYYLIIPRYSDMELKLYQNDIQTGDSTLMFEDPACRPFLIQCNVSDIFLDVSVCLTWREETVSFSPYISLEDGGVEVGDRGLDLVRRE